MSPASLAGHGLVQGDPLPSPSQLLALSDCVLTRSSTGQHCPLVGLVL